MCRVKYLVYRGYDNDLHRISDEESDVVYIYLSTERGYVVGMNVHGAVVEVEIRESQAMWSDLYPVDVKEVA